MNINVTFLKLSVFISFVFVFSLSVLNNNARATGRGTNTVKSISYSDDSIRVDLTRKTTYRVGVLEENIEHNLPDRIYVDLENTVLGSTVANIYDISSNIIQQIRAAQTTKDRVRIVFDLKEKLAREHCKIYFDKDNSLLVELVSPKTESAEFEKQIKTEPARSEGKKTVEVVEREKRKYVVVIDPGHGGKDPGAVGYKELLEKEVSLLIAMELKKRIDRDGKYKAIMTRNSDEFVSLQQRADIANSINADLFISIHANSHHDNSLTGLETYYLNFSSDAAARRVAARENFTTPEEIGDLEMILFDLLQSNKINVSSILAGHIHNSLIASLSKKQNIRNLGVKHAPFRVLIDADMPGVLIEAAFISNSKEAILLQKQSHQRLLSNAIFNGIEKFLKSEQTALYISK